MMVSSGHLRLCQLLVFFISATSGLVVSIAVGWTSKIVLGQCVLYSNMAISKTVNGSIFVSLDHTVWGTKIQCEFSTFCPVGITIYCVIWMWFYVFLSDWGTSFIESKEEREQKEPDRPPPDQHLLVPSIVCNVLVLGLLLATIAMVEAGKSVWCEHVIDVLKEPSCSYVGDVPWVNLKGGEDLYRYLKHASAGCWVLLVTMVVQTLIMIIRLRRNSQRIILLELIEEETEDEDGDVMTEGDATSTDSEDDMIQTRRRRLQKQKRVVIDVSVPSLDESIPGVSANLLNNQDDSDMEL